MRRILLPILAVMVLGFPARAATETLAEQYLAVYLKINEAESAERNSDYKGAVTTFKVCYLQLLAIQKADPDWETALVQHRINDVRAKLIELYPKAYPAAHQIAAPPSDGPWLSPELKAFLKANPVEKTAAQFHTLYPWKEDIPASEFWIGEDRSKASAWAANWVQENGGKDAPEDRSGYAPGGHASRVNPFYVALPFNDLAHPELAQRWLPKGWARIPRHGVPVSACKDRWIELKNARGDVCYAQWEDVGPNGNADAAYVFGNQPPATAAGPGIDLSPAVATYLGLTGDAPRVVSWRFVDDANVRPGQWLKLDEQAVIFLAMHLRHED